MWPLRVHPVRLSVCLSVRLSVSLFVCLSVYPSVCLSVRLSICLSVRPSVCLSICLCRLLNVPTHYFADVQFNWRQASAATAGSQQQACCVSLCTLLGRAAVVATVDQADTLVNNHFTPASASLTFYTKIINNIFKSSQVKSVIFIG